MLFQGYQTYNIQLYELYICTIQGDICVIFGKAYLINTSIRYLSKALYILNWLFAIELFQITIKLPRLWHINLEDCIKSSYQCSGFTVNIFTDMARNFKHVCKIIFLSVVRNFYPILCSILTCLNKDIDLLIC